MSAALPSAPALPIQTLVAAPPTGTHMRLDEQFAILPNDPVAPTFRRLMPVLELRFQALEGQRTELNTVIEQLREVSLYRIDDVLLPIVERMQALGRHGWFLVHSETSLTLQQNEDRLFIIEAGAERDLFVPTPFLAIQREANSNDYAFALLHAYDASNGFLSVKILSVWGNPGPHTDWVITAGPGIAEATRYWFEQTLALGNHAADEADRAGREADRAGANADRSQVNRDWMDQIRETLTEAGMDTSAFVWIDGSRSFTGIVRGVAPASTANGNELVTAAWAKANAGGGVALDNPTFTGTLAGPNANFSGNISRGGVNLNSIYAPLASPNFTGSISRGGTNLDSIYAPIANPNFTGSLRLNGQPFTGSGGTSVPIYASAPGSAANGDLWFDSINLQLFIRYNNQWVIVTSVPAVTPPVVPPREDIARSTATIMLGSTNGAATLTGAAPELLRIGDTVFCSYQGANKNSTTATSVSLFWIPQGFRPNATVTQAIQAPSVNITIGVQTSGTSVFPDLPSTNNLTSGRWVARTSAQFASNAAVSLAMQWRTADAWPT